MRIEHQPQAVIPEPPSPRQGPQRNGPPDHAPAHGYRRIHLSPRGQRFAAFSALDRSERQELRAFRQELGSAVRSGDPNVEELTDKAPEALHRLAEELGRDLQELIEERVAFLSARFGGAAAEASSGVSESGPASETDAETTSEPVDSTVSAAPELSKEITVFAARLYELFSSFEIKIENLLAALEPYLDDHEVDDVADEADDAQVDDAADLADVAEDGEDEPEAA